MARFYANIQGNKGEATRMGSANSGITSHLRGWDLGVQVSGYDVEEHDAFDVTISGGSHGARRSVSLGTIEQMRDGSVRVRLGDQFGGGLFDLNTGRIE